MNTIKRIKKTLISGAFIAAFSILGIAYGAGFSYQEISDTEPAEKWKTIVGWTDQHTVKETETLLDIARDYELGWNEIALAYPDIDPWIPEEGIELSIPACWILPTAKKEGIVINVPEMRLYRYTPESHIVETYPVGIGTEEYQTPLGEFSVIDRQEDPVWAVPPSLREKYTFSYMPPGPNNPLGKYWLGLSTDHIGIHGTNFPWAVGRQVSRGCIRLYPEHIKRLYPEVEVGTTVRIVYETVKVGIVNGNIYMEVHPDADGMTTDAESEATIRLQQFGEECNISHETVQKVLREKNGVPVCIGSILGGGDDGAFRADRLEDKTLLKEEIN